MSNNIYYDYGQLLRKTMQCNCDLDSWEPERTTGHSLVCRIHKAIKEKTEKQIRSILHNAELADAVAPYKTLLQEVHDLLEWINRESGAPKRLCLRCSSVDYDGERGIIHRDECIIKRIRGVMG